MTHDHDKLFRHTFAQPQNAISLLLSILPPSVARGIDWASLRQLPGSSVDEALDLRHSDLLFSVNLHGRRVLLYVLFEHKSGDDHFTAFQLVRYVVRAYDRFLEENPGATSLPPIVPIVVHHGEEGWQAPRDLRELIDLGSLPPEIREFLAPLQPNLRFLIDDLATVSEAELRERTGTVMHGSRTCCCSSCGRPPNGTPSSSCFAGTTSCWHCGTTPTDARASTRYSPTSPPSSKRRQSASPLPGP